MTSFQDAAMADGGLPTVLHTLHAWLDTQQGKTAATDVPWMAGKGRAAHSEPTAQADDSGD